MPLTHSRPQRRLCENGNQEWGDKDETHETDVQVTCTAEWNGSYKNQAIDIKSEWPTVLTFVNCVDFHSRLSKKFFSQQNYTFFTNSILLKANYKLFRNLSNLVM